MALECEFEQNKMKTILKEPVEFSQTILNYYFLICRMVDLGVALIYQPEILSSSSIVC